MPTGKSKVGVNTSLQWPTGLGGKGNEGVAAIVSRTDGAIGYVEYAYAKQNKMTYAQMQNHAGKFVAPDNEIVPGGRRERRLGRSRPATTSC